MKNQNIPKNILHWYDNNKRVLPWRKQVSKKQTQYFTLVSEFMLQQTQVKTVIPYFNNFINKIPNLKKLSIVSEPKLMKCWEGLGYYARARNLKKTAKKVISEFNGDLPSTIAELKTLPGIGDYTSRAIMAIAFNKPIIPLDGNVERVLKRIFYLRNENEISKDNIINKKSFFGKSNRSSDYAQAIMEIGALICKPTNPSCFECPISKNCKSYKKNDFEIKSKNKFNKIKYFEADIYQNQNKYLLIKNSKFKFLKNLLIFPMKEVKKNKFNTSMNKKIIIKMSNMDMKIVLNKKNKLIKIRNSYLLDKKNVKSQILPSFTKKIFNSVSNYS
jgi:A/G-specific adenine glycosylase